jgi:N-methylhydantoinase B/oxoprolinase/acetone carboxylase alpha subunit
VRHRYILASLNDGLAALRRAEAPAVQRGDDATAGDLAARIAAVEQSIEALRRLFERGYQGTVQRGPDGLMTGFVLLPIPN